VAKEPHPNSVAASWTGIGVVAGFAAVMLITQGPHMKHIAAYWRIKLLHILQEVGSICKTRNQLKITIDGSDANEAAIKSSNEAHGTHIIIRQVKYLNNIVEQDHRAVKRVTRPMLGFKAFEAAQDTLVGIELMHMIKKKQLMVETGDEGLTAAELFYSLAA
jgi:hypothetical protein